MLLIIFKEEVKCIETLCLTGLLMADWLTDSNLNMQALIICGKRHSSVK